MDTNIQDMELAGKAIEYLQKQDGILHINMTENLRQGRFAHLKMAEKGVRCRVNDVWFLSAEDEAAAMGLMADVENPAQIMAHQLFYAPALRAKYDMYDQMVCYSMAYLAKEPMAFLDNGVEFRPLDGTWFGFVREHYLNPVDDEYIRERLAAGVMVGAFIGGEPVGFAGEHEEGTLGFLEVLPEYRRRGIATSITAFLVNRFLEQGRTPNSQVEQNNEPSLAMQKSLGFVQSKTCAVWMGPARG